MAISTHKILTVFRTLLLAFCLPLTLLSQTTYPQNYFINPLDIPITLAGTFGEIRSNHFHTGLDMRTEEHDGLPVHAAADGYVSRINVSAYGYGNALYITHPNGYVTVYGHLSRYNAVIAAYVKKRQYEKEKYSVDLFLTPTEIPIKKGDTVAYSGSTGGAAGPHLHFEIRDGKTEDPLNPFLFGFTSVDHEPPVIRGICIYPLNDSSNVNGKHEPFFIKAKKRESKYVLESDSVIKAYGKIGVGISTYDMSEAGSGHNGPYSQLLTQDGDTIYFASVDELSFSSIHYVNGHVDYEAYKEKDLTIEHSFQTDNDALGIYKKIKNRGRINCIGGKKFKMQYTIRDWNGNPAVLPFTIESGTHIGTISHDSLSYNAIAHWRKAFDYQAPGILVHIPALTLFEDLRFRCVTDTTNFHVLSSVYAVGNKYTPLDGPFTVSIKPLAPMADSILRRAVVVQLDGHHANALTSEWQQGYLIAHPKTFGKFAIMFDLLRPVIKPINIYKNKNMDKASTIEFEITDNLSGIGTFNCYVDGKWILMEFNYKKDMIYYTFDEHVGPGKHHLKLVVTDNVGNNNVYQTDFTR